MTWRAVNSYGIKISHRSYDCAGLNPYRRQHSGVTAKKGLWEVHHDPYDVSRIWVRNHHDGGWITVPWTHLKPRPAPFGELAWDHARQMLARRGESPATEAEIADAVDALLDRAGKRPAGDRPPAGRRAAGPGPPRTRQARLAAPAAGDRPSRGATSPTNRARRRHRRQGDPARIFDPFAEASKRW